MRFLYALYNIARCVSMYWHTLPILYSILFLLVLLFLNNQAYFFDSKREEEIFKLIYVLESQA